MTLWQYRRTTAKCSFHLFEYGRQLDLFRLLLLFQGSSNSNWIISVLDQGFKVVQGAELDEKPNLVECFPFGTESDLLPKYLGWVTFSVLCQREKIPCAQLESNDKNLFPLWEDPASFAFQTLSQFDSGSWIHLSQGFMDCPEPTRTQSALWKTPSFMDRPNRRHKLNSHPFNPLAGPKHVTFLTIFVEDVTKNALSHCSFRKVFFNCFKLMPWTFGKISPSSTISWLIRATSYW